MPWALTEQGWAVTSERGHLQSLWLNAPPKCLWAKGVAPFPSFVLLHRPTLGSAGPSTILSMGQVGTQEDETAMFPAG